MKILVFLLSCLFFSVFCHPEVAQVERTSLYDFVINDIDANPISLSRYRGHVLMIINTASKCAWTTWNMKQMKQLHEKYGESHGFKILAFPSNEFGDREPGSVADMLGRYEVLGRGAFDLFERVMVNGENAHPLYKWLKSLKPEVGKNVSKIVANYFKFIMDREGNLVATVQPKVKNEVIEDIILKLF